MDWRSVTFDWNRARAFLVTAEEGSLSAAARALGLTQPTLGRQVSALERELGVTLFTRAGNKMDLTEAGLRLIDHVRGMGAAATALSRAASGQSQLIAGPVTITASDLYATYLLPPIVARLKSEYPALRITIVASNAIRDLMRREADIAIRHVRPAQPDLIARQVATDEAFLYATPAYLARVQPITGPGDLSAASFIGYDETDTYLGYLTERGIAASADSFAALSEDHHVQWALCQAGLGIANGPRWRGDPDPKVIRALPGDTPFVRFPVWLTAHREVHTSARVRLVFDRLAEALSLLPDHPGTA